MRYFETDARATAPGFAPCAESAAHLAPGESAQGERSADSAAEHGSKSPFVLASVIAGFGLCRAWIVSCLSVAAFVHTPEASWLFLAMGGVAAAFIAFIAYKTGIANERFREHSAEATLILSVVAALLIPASLAIHSQLLTLTAFMVGGVAAGLLQILWGERFVALSHRFVIAASGGSTIVTAVCLTLASDPFRLLLSILLPLVSFALLMVACQASGTSWRTGLPSDPEELEAFLAAQEESRAREAAQAENENAALAQNSNAPDFAEGAHPKSRSMASVTAKLMISIGVFSFLARMLDSLPASGTDPFATMGGSSLFALVIVGTVFLFVAVLSRRDFDATLVYRISVPIMVLGFTALALFSAENSAISILLVNVGYEFFDVLAWILFAHLARRHTSGVAYIYGMGVTCMFAGMAAGLLAGELTHALVSNGAMQITVVAFACIFSLVIVGFMVFPESMLTQLAHRKSEHKHTTPDADQEAPVENAQAEAPAEATLEERCAVAATRHGLTPRESEILVMLARGRTIAIIARDLQIAKGTARTHTERIYRKLDVHKQQELIDLVEAVEA